MTAAVSARDVRRDAAELRRGLRRHARADRHRVVGRVHGAPREHTEARRAEREQIGPRVDLDDAPGRLLRRHVRRRPDREPDDRLVRCLLREAREAEVEDLDPRRRVRASPDRARGTGSPASDRDARRPPCARRRARRGPRADRQELALGDRRALSRCDPRATALEELHDEERRCRRRGRRR